MRREGPDVSMEDVAGACGVTKPILYRHFGDRDGLVHAMGAHFVTDLVFELAGAIRAASPSRSACAARSTPSSPASRPTPTCTASSFATRHRRPSSSSSPCSPKRWPACSASCSRTPALDPAPAEIWAYALVGSVHVAGDWWTARGTVTRDELVTRLTDLLLSGLEGQGLDPERRI
ncbi:MAG: TetR/AcrR family transcriptional regulator [Acidimicrobiia bacterium]|nr:TetR/AcrR family transcriptional regulator [Acidimicrobiia bacterium]